MHISSCYAKILGETNFRTREIPRSGSKAKNGEKKRRRRGERDLTMVKTMAKLRMAHASTHGARKPPGPIISHMGDSPKWVKSRRCRRKSYAWRTQARMAQASRLGQKEKRKKVGENNSRLDQNKKSR